MINGSTPNPSNANDTYCSFFMTDFDLKQREPLPETVEPTWIFLCIFNSLTAIPTVVINFLIIWTVFGSRRLRSVNYNLILACLAVSDFFVGAFVLPMLISYLSCLLHLNCSIRCISFYFLAMFSMFSTFFTLSTLMVLSVERFIAVQYPFFYRQKLTNKKVMVFVSFLWICLPTSAILLRIFVNDSQTFRKLPTFIFLFSNAVVILFCTVKVHVIAYKKRRSIALITSTTQLNVAEQQKEIRRSLTTGIMVLASVILYSPLITVTIIETVYGQDVTRDFKFISQAIATTFLCLQSLVNPLIFALRMSYISQGVKNKLFCCTTNAAPVVESFVLR